MTEEVPRLPADIIANIAYRADIPIAQRSRLSRGIEARSREYLKMECETPISKKEYTTYLGKNPPHIGIFIYHLYEQPSMNILDANSILLSNMVDFWHGLQIYMNMDDSDINYDINQLEEDYSDILKPSIFRQLTFDVLTNYRIYKNRLNCMRISSAFAKDLTIKKFLDKLNELESLQDNKNIFVIYSYLYMNAHVLNILAPKPELTSAILLGDDSQPLPGQLDRADVQILIEQIPILTEKIVKEIEKFD